MTTKLDITCDSYEWSRRYDQTGEIIEAWRTCEDLSFDMHDMHQLDMKCWDKCDNLSVNSTNVQNLNIEPEYGQYTNLTLLATNCGEVIIMPNDDGIANTSI